MYFFSSVISNAKFDNIVSDDIVIANNRMTVWKQFLVCLINTRPYVLISNEIKC